MSQRVDTPRPTMKHPGGGRINSEGGAYQSVVDPALELTDPTPDIQQLFQQFNDRFFGGRLNAVVMWSSKLTRTCGLFYPVKNGLCSIRLSEPLLKLRPRKDLVETLLHEMIHAYLFVYKLNDSHGPNFLHHMNRINREAGTNVTVYHRFHEEVHFQNQHWYRCDGPCSRRIPCFATKRHKRCPPWPCDDYWRSHKDVCGGTFRKVRGPGARARAAKKERRSENKESQ